MVRGFYVSHRDEEMMKDLYRAPHQKTEQLQIAGGFKRYESCRRQLYRLAKRELLEPCTILPGLTVWRLTDWAWRRQAEAVGRFGERNREWPTPEKIEHFVDANDVYVTVSPYLDNILGKYPEWEWVDERRATRNYRTRDGNKKHQPDAEIRFGGKVYFIERQTHRARKPQSEFDKRCARYRSYLDYFGYDDDNVTLVFICDTERDINYALKSTKNNNVPHFVNTLEKVEEWFSGEAKEAARRRERELAEQ